MPVTTDTTKCFTGALQPGYLLASERWPALWLVHSLTIVVGKSRYWPDQVSRTVWVESPVVAIVLTNNYRQALIKTEVCTAWVSPPCQAAAGNVVLLQGPLSGTLLHCNFLFPCKAKELCSQWTYRAVPFVPQLSSSLQKRSSERYPSHLFHLRGIAHQKRRRHDR
jgi:hypothetical protein